VRIKIGLSGNHLFVLLSAYVSGPESPSGLITEHQDSATQTPKGVIDNVLVIN
jgi:hypothetical protein